MHIPFLRKAPPTGSKQVVSASNLNEKLPGELLVDIFGWCIHDALLSRGPTSAFPLPMNKEHPCLVLSWICRHWRGQIIGSSFLWSDVCVIPSDGRGEASLFRLWHQRAKELPLNLTVILTRPFAVLPGRSHPSLFAVFSRSVAPSIGRIAVYYLDETGAVTSMVNSLVGSLNLRFSALTHAAFYDCMSGSTGSGLRTDHILRNTPQLTTLQWQGPQMLLHVTGNYQLHNLESLSLGNVNSLYPSNAIHPEEFLSVLSTLPSLRSCRVRLVCGDLPEDRHVRHECLLELTIRWSAGDDAVHWVDWLTLPQLERLDLAQFHSGSDAEELHRIGSLLNRSGCELSSLTLNWGDAMNDWEKSSATQSCPRQPTHLTALLAHDRVNRSLEELQLVLTERDGHVPLFLLEHLTCSQSHSPLPRLTRLTITILSEDLEALRELVSCRQRLAGFKALRSLRLTVRYTSETKQWSRMTVAEIGRMVEHFDYDEYQDF